ncbi:hypothetical protein TNIN_270461 [Trichonephila inaurata madagascariensis]|uniref:Uncharacterized protein n=1 Tax=Trichonephila inaurata madagascariensis TaxID=2747483 RepID=A0A8X7C0E9_9ARAC|nr:hypothetical protein TNIN_270461 [Trichonephila inaurata madagascariensis]
MDFNFAGRPPVWFYPLSFQWDEHFPLLPLWWHAEAGRGGDDTTFVAGTRSCKLREGVEALACSGIKRIFTKPGCVR